MIVDMLEPQREDWQSFNLEKAKPDLRELQKAEVGEILDDLSAITRIYERDDLHLGVLMTMVCPRHFHMPTEGRIRGRVNTIVVGDTGTGKTTVSETMFNYAKCGYRVSGMTSSRTGITYACEFDERLGWRLKAGALLKMSRQALIVDEAQDLKMEELKTMAEGIDTGYVRIARIETRTFESETRTLFSCNPKAPRQEAEQRTMDSFWYGCTAVSDVFPKMFIRRMDLILFATSYDIKDISKLYTQRTTEPKYVTPERLRALVHYAWNLRDDQVFISEEVNEAILKRSLELSEMHRQCDDLPIVYP
jgi:DNA replicative helicase MCM subunit Mcm2 (Cdc46/Mcm family)